MDRDLIGNQITSYFYMFIYIFIVILFLTMHERDMEVFPNLIVSIPISTISPILAVDINSILEIHFVTIFDELI